MLTYLRIEGRDGVHVLDLGLGQSEDSDTWRYAPDHDAVVITKDTDFIVLATANPGPRVLRVCLGNCSNRQLLQQLERDFAMILDRLDNGSRLVELNW